MTQRDDTGQLLEALRAGEPGALDRLMPRVYQELHRIAQRELARHADPPTLPTTGLVHEAYLKLVDQERVSVESRGHFMALAATAMRHIVVDFARKRTAKKRGGGWERVTLDELPSASHASPETLIEIDEALARLGRLDERLCKVVECRCFAAMTVEETAEALGTSPRTVDRAWQRAKAWLYREIHETE